MASDARIATGLPSHPKTKKLIRKLGQAAGWNLICLILWAAANRSDGDLSGLSAEDIEIAAEWDGKEGEFVAALVAVRFLDGDEGVYELHDWAEHNPWAAGAEKRSAKARWNAVRRYHGAAEADRQVPEYASVRQSQHASSSADSTTTAQDQQASSMLPVDGSTAPSPSPSPSPSPTPSSSSLRSEEGADKPRPSRPKREEITLKAYLQQCREQGTKAVPEDHPVRAYCRDLGASEEMVQVAWCVFREDYTTGKGKDKRYRDWPTHFHNAIRKGWVKVWYTTADGQVEWSQIGLQTRKVLDERQRSKEVTHAA